MRSLRHLILPILCASSLLALDSSKSLTQYAHRTWGLDEGLFQPTIYSISQTPDGFLWLGTQDSLIRFDGMRFHEFDSGGVALLHGNLVRSLIEDRSNNLWVGTVGSGVFRLSQDGSITRYGPPNGAPGSNVFCLDLDRDGRVWACTDKGLMRLDAKGMTSISTGNSFPEPGVRGTCDAGNGTRWIAGLSSGLARSNRNGFAPFADERVLPHAPINALTCAHDGSVWAGSAEGLLQISGNAARGNAVRVFTAADGLADNAVSSILEDPDGSLWIGTDDGISRYRNGHFDVYRPADGLSHGQVLSIYIDREGTLWAGTKDGLDQFTNPKVTPYTTHEGMPSNQASAVIEDAGALWIGTLDAGLARFSHGQFYRETAGDGLPSDRVLSLTTDAFGDVWVGTDRGLARLRHNRVAQVYTKRNGLSGDAVRTLYTDGAGTVWAGTGRGLDKFYGASFRHALLETMAAGVTAIGEDGSRTLLVSADADRLRFLRNGEFGSFPLTHTSRPVDCYLADPQSGAVWMGTVGSGLLRWKRGALAHVHVSNGLYDNRIYGILEAGADLWIASSKGIFRVARKELNDFADGKRASITSIPFSTGQLRFECRSGVQPAAWRTRDGRLWFSTTTGLVLVDPNHLKSNPIPPQVRCTAFFVDGRRIDPRGSLRLKHSDRNLQIRYAGLSFIAPEKVTFRYMLEGYDKQWIDAGTRREAFYTNLPPGDFRFRVQARNADGVWSAGAAELLFNVEPRLYQRAWFWPALVALLAIAIAAVYRLRVRHLRRRFGVILAERTRIARELHDTLLQGMSGVTMQLQALWTELPASPARQKLAEIIRDASTCSAQARQSLWGLRGGEAGQRSSFSERLSALARETVLGEPVALQLKLDPVSLDDRPDAQFQLLRIAREAISNALRHGAPSRVEVMLHAADEEVVMTIEDDGIGFSLSAPRQGSGHFGLLGIEERAAEIGATLQIASDPGHGTTVSVSLPARRPVTPNSPLSLVR
ncbi:MAG: hypothetical protein JO061_07340 [Acidobacteriaceae bacterium]|nr:hypothetical protein [Acidobacteriaceae bacterium]